MPSNDSVEQVTPSVDALPPIYMRRGALKVVYSNRPDLVRQHPHRIFRSPEDLMWYPEDTIVGDTLEQSLAAIAKNDFIVVTNSLYVLRAFQMARHRLGKTVLFVYVRFDPEPHDAHAHPFRLHMSDNLEALPVPQLEWENTQSEGYLEGLLEMDASGDDGNPPQSPAVETASAKLERHNAALAKLYREQGIGPTVKERLTYWESTVPDGYSLSHDPSDAQRVAIFEATWLYEQFPQDFLFY